MKPARSGWPEAEAPCGKGGVYLIRSLWRNKTARSVEKKDPGGTKYTQQDGLIRENRDAPMVRVVPSLCGKQTDLVNNQIIVAFLRVAALKEKTREVNTPYVG